MDSYRPTFHREQIPASKWRMAGSFAKIGQMSMRSATLNASSSSAPRYRTVQSTLVSLINICTARRFPVLRLTSAAFVLRKECVPIKGKQPYQITVKRRHFRGLHRLSGRLSQLLLGLKQATWPVSGVAFKSGTSRAHVSRACGQRARKAQPSGGLSGSGSSVS